MTHETPPEKPEKPKETLPESEAALDPQAATIARRTDTLMRVINALQPDAATGETPADGETLTPDMTLTRPPTALLDVLEQVKAEIIMPDPAPETPPPAAKPESEAQSIFDSWDAPAPKPSEPAAAKSILDAWNTPAPKPAETPTEPPARVPSAAEIAAEAPTLPLANRDQLLKKLEELEKLGVASDTTVVSLKSSAKDLQPPEATKPEKPKSEPTRPDVLMDKRATGEIKVATGEFKRATGEMKLIPAERPQARVIDAESITRRAENALTGSPDEAPWTLQQFFNGEIDLDVELTKRFPTMPMMSLVKFRTLGASNARRVATLSTQDGAASLIVDADVSTKVIQMSFTLGSMLTLRFAMTDLSDMDRTRWLDLMRREQGGLTFLWGPARWAQDYMICISRKYHTNLYAFSPHNFEAAIRLTPVVTKQLLDWLDEFWQAEDNSNDEQPPLLTW